MFKTHFGYNIQYKAQNFKCNIEPTDIVRVVCYISNVIFEMVSFYSEGSTVEVDCLGVSLVFVFPLFVSSALDLSVPIGKRKNKNNNKRY